MTGRERLAWVLAALATLAACGWLFTRTEWVELEVDAPPRGAAARDEWHVTSALLQRLGVPVQRQTHLDTLPPPGTTLWLESTYWDLFPERSEQLHRWVEQGGHLVVSSYQLQPGDPLAQWVPLHVRYPAARKEQRADTDEDAADPRADDEEEDDAPDAGPRRPPVMSPPASAPGPAGSAPVVPAAPARALPSRLALQGCMDLRPRPAAPADDRLLRVCGGLTPLVLATHATPLLSLESPRGTYALRVPVGAGRVTAMGTLPFTWRQVLEHDHALVLAAVLGVQPGQPLWLVSDETRPPLLVTLWERGAPAVLLGTLALALALWRAGRRFGPPAAVPPAARRSVAEQVRGTARFVWKHSPAALLAAQQRATVQAAQLHVPRFAALDVAARAAALARLTGLPQAALAQALGPVQPGAPARTQTLALLETARRRLAALPPASAAAGLPAPSDTSARLPHKKDTHGP